MPPARPFFPPPAFPAPRSRVIQGRFAAGRPPFAAGAPAGPGGRAVPVPPHLQHIGRGLPGRPLPGALQCQMESFFGASLADVRIHVGPEATSLGALAFTLGSAVYFAPGQYDPQSSHGRQLLGHELTHVLQQRQGRVASPFSSGLAVVQDPFLEAEADRMGLRAAVQLAVPTRPWRPPARPSVPRPALPVRPHRSGTVQRMEMDLGSMEVEIPHLKKQQGLSEDVYRELRDLAVEAYLHMRSLVIHNDKDSAKLSIGRLDDEAAKTYRTYDEDRFYPSEDFRDVAAVTQVGGVHYYATNNVVPDSMKARLESQHDKHGKQFDYVDERRLEQNALCLHAEMKLFARFGSSADYIGINKLCCLYCAAQLLASGFHGFRGCHMKSFNNYQWLPAVYARGSHGDGFRVALWGERVAGVLVSLEEIHWLQFLHTISQGGTLMQAADEYKAKHYFAVKKYSDANQYPLVPDTGYDSDEDRPDYARRLGDRGRF